MPRYSSLLFCVVELLCGFQGQKLCHEQRISSRFCLGEEWPETLLDSNNSFPSKICAQWDLFHVTASNRPFERD